MSAPATGRVLRTDAGNVSRVTLSHPGKQNALSVAMWQALGAAFRDLQALPAEQAPRVVVISGEGEHFAAGADIAEFPLFRFEPASLKHYHEEIIATALQAVLDCDIPVIAQIRGSCVGGGLEIAACCDLRIAARDARLGVPIARLGFPIAPAELLAVSRVADAATLRELLLDARIYTADEALSKGLLHGVVDDLDAAVQARTENIAALAPQALRANKRALRELALGRLAKAPREPFFAYAGDAEHLEGVQAFLARRPPHF